MKAVRKKLGQYSMKYSGVKASIPNDPDCITAFVKGNLGGEKVT